MPKYLVKDISKNYQSYEKSQQLLKYCQFRTAKYPLHLIDAPWLAILHDPLKLIFSGHGNGSERSCDMTCKCTGFVRDR